MDDGPLLRDALVAAGYDVRRGKTSAGAPFFRWHREQEYGGGYPTEDEAWKEAALHLGMQIERAKRAH